MTFLEMMAVVIVIGIVSALAIKPIQGMLIRIKLQSAGNGIKQMLMNARLRSVVNPERLCGVVFRLHADTDVTDSVFAFFDTSPSDKIYTKGQDSLYLAPILVKGKERVVTTIPESFPSVIVFRGDGSASASARVLLTYKGMADTLEVLASTGRVRVIK